MLESAFAMLKMLLGLCYKMVNNVSNIRANFYGVHFVFIS